MTRIRHALRDSFWRVTRATLPQGVYERLFEWRSRAAAARFTPKVVTHNYGTGPLTIELRDPIGSSWYDRDWPDLAECVLLRRGGLRPGATVFDIGGHQAVVALMLAREVGPTGRVIVVEPSPHNVAAARRNAELNPGLTFTLVPAAVSDTNGTIQVGDTVNFNLQVSTSDAPKQTPKIDVRAVTVDQLSKEYGAPDVLFVDVEGYECSVLKGAAEVLRRKPDCFVEVHVGQGLEKFGSVAELLSFFPTKDFDLFARSWDGEAFQPFRGIDDPVVQRMFLLVALSKREPTSAGAGA